VSSRGARWLWMTTEGITGELVMQEAQRLHIGVTSDDPEELDKIGAVKLSGITAEDSMRLRDAVYAHIGIVDADRFDRERSLDSTIYREWAAERLRNPPPYHIRGDREGPAQPAAKRKSRNLL
jgi:hypothetical protein